MPNTSTPRHIRHLARVGLTPRATGTAYAASFRGTHAFLPGLSLYRREARETRDPLHLLFVARTMLRPSPLILADSLRDMLRGMTCPVASAILRATESAYGCATRLPGNHYAWRETAGKVSYCPRGREQALNAEGRWARAGRQDTTPARFARAVLPARVLRDLGDAALSTFAQRFAAAEEAHNVTIEIREDVAGINAAFRAASYVPGPMHEVDDSCMNNDPVGNWYVRAGARLLVASTGHGILARAVLWTLEDGTTYMDRVYSRQEAGHEAMHAHAIQQGWTRRAGRSVHNYREYLLPDGSEVRGDLTVRTAHMMDASGEDCYVPYHDTFCRLSECGRYLHNDVAEEAGCWLIRGTCGEGSPARSGQVRTESGNWIDEDDSRTTIDDETHHVDDVVLCEEDGCYYPDGDERVAFCDHRQEYILAENARTVRIGRNTYTVHMDQIDEL